LESNRFSNIQSSEYQLSGDASIVIRGQRFDNALIAETGSSTNNLVKIVDSGIIEVNDPADDDDYEDGTYLNTDDTPYRKIISDGDSILINS